MNTQDCCKIYKHRFTASDDQRALRAANEPFKQESFLFWPILFINAVMLTAWLLAN